MAPRDAPRVAEVVPNTRRALGAVRGEVHGEGWAALPKDVLLHVLGFCGRGWFTTTPEVDAAAAVAEGEDAGGEEAGD